MPISEDDHARAADQAAALTRRIDDGTEAQRERDTLARQLHADGWTQAALADLFGITQQRISRIINPAPKR